MFRWSAKVHWSGKNITYCNRGSSNSIKLILRKRIMNNFDFRLERSEKLRISMFLLLTEIFTTGSFAGSFMEFAAKMHYRVNKVFGPWS